MSKHYTDDDVAALKQPILDNFHPPTNAKPSWHIRPDEMARAVLDAVAPAIAARALREEACPIVSDSRDQGLGMGAAQRAIWRRADEIEAGR